jgi:pyruvate dehydrogenase E1 component alpha subunit/2-oxoisovalerate dehydrogenase E1 component alpha subunit
MPPDARSEDPALGLLSVLRDDGRTDPATDPFLPPETLLSMYRDMCRSRALDVALVELQRKGRIGFYAAALGQEAVPIGAAFALDPEDWVFPARREGAVLLVRGFPLARLVAQAFGSASDVQKGRQPPNHASSRALNVASSSSTIGTQLPQAVGAAWAARKRGARVATVGFVGDGGTSTPDFHSALNFAGVFRAPCIVICQNNGFAVSTEAARQTASATFAVKAKAYGIAGLRVDGNDVLAVHRAVSEARVRAVAGAGATLIECVTYRLSPYEIQPDEGAAETGPPAIPARPDDPLERFRKHLVYIGAIDAPRDESIREAARREVAEAVETVSAEPPPAHETLFDDVYAERPFNLVEQARDGVD